MIQAPSPATAILLVALLVASGCVGPAPPEPLPAGPEAGPLSELDADPHAGTPDGTFPAPAPRGAGPAPRASDPGRDEAPPTTAGVGFEHTPSRPHDGRATTFWSTLAPGPMLARDLGTATIAWELDGAPWTTGHRVEARLDAGLHEVCVRVLGQAGTHTAQATCRTVPVANAPPVAAFEIDPIQPEPGVPLHLVDTSWDPSPGDAIVQWTWTVDGAHVGTGPELELTLGPGQHTIELEVIDEHGARDVATRRVELAPTTPVARFAVGAEAGVGVGAGAGGGVGAEVLAWGEPVRLTDTSWHTGHRSTLVSRTWTLPGPTVVVCAAMGPCDDVPDAVGLERPDGSMLAWSAPARGAHRVCLEVTDVRGASSQACRSVQVEGPTPRPNVTWTPAHPRLGEPVSLVATAEGLVPGNAVEAWAWSVRPADGDRRDGQRALVEARGPNANVTFAAKGAYHITLAIVDAAGREASLRRTLEVANRAPEIGGPDALEVLANRTLAARFQVSDPDDGDAVTVLAPGAPRGVTLDPTTGRLTWRPTPDQLGEHAITLRATDGTANTSHLVHVTVERNRAPVVLVAGERFPDPGRNVTYDASASFDPDGARPLSFAWSVNGTRDGPWPRPVALGNGTEVQVAFPVAGRYTLTTVALDADGMRTVHHGRVDVDDGLRLAIELRAGPTGKVATDRRPLLRATVTDEWGVGVPNATVSFAVLHEARFVLLGTGTFTTTDDGTGAMAVPFDLCRPAFGNLPGGHLLFARAVVGSSRDNGSRPGSETAEAFLRYVVAPDVGPAAFVPPMTNALPRDPIFGGVESALPAIACELISAALDVVPGPVP